MGRLADIAKRRIQRDWYNNTLRRLEVASKSDEAAKQLGYTNAAEAKKLYYQHISRNKGKF